MKKEGVFLRFAVLGMGKTGHVMAAYLKNQGHDILCWDRSKEKVDTINQRGITITGEFEGTFPVNATTNLQEAVKGREIIIIMTVANGHRPVAELLSGALEEGQRIIILNGNWGAVEFYQVLGEEAKKKNVIISETGGMLFIAKLEEISRCCVLAVKSSVTLGTIPCDRVHHLIGELKDVFPQFAAAENVIETSLNSANPIMHVPVTFFNITRIDNQEDYGFYDQGATQKVFQYISKADQERVAVAKAMGVKEESCLDIINSYWVKKYDTLYEAIKNNESYLKLKGPITFDHRFITEDVPYGIAPIVRLGDKYGVDTPYLKSLLAMCYLIFDDGRIGQGPDFSEMNLEAFL
jgi:opine dehydrogenase